MSNPRKKCPQTGFKKRCIGDDCEWFIKVRGYDINSGQDIDQEGCSITFLPMLLIENSGMQRQTGAAVESMRNETVKGMNLTVKAIVAAATGQIQPPRLEGQKGEDHARISHQE